MQFRVYPTKDTMGKAAAERAATLLREALAHRETVRDCFLVDAEITPLHPASILKIHEHCDVFLDEAATGEIRT